jgi:hypothetical protein
VYGAANGGPNGDLTVNGDLLVTTATMRGISATTGTRTHTVAGNVILGPGTGARISAVNSSSATDASVTWNIAGNVALTGNNSGNRLIWFESAGPHSGTATYNIDGDITIGTASILEFRTSSGAVAYGTAVLNLKGDLQNNGGTIRIQASGTAGSWAFNLNGTTPQTISNTGTISILSLTLALNVNNAAGVSLGSALVIPANMTVNLTSGLLTTTDANLLTIGAGNLTGGSSASYIDGPLAWDIPTGSPSRAFPIGSAGNYSPVNVQFATVSTAGSLKAVTMSGDHTQIGTSEINVSKSLNRTYTLTNTGVVFTTYNAVFNFVASDVDTATDPLNFIAQKFNGAWWDLTEGTRTATSTEVVGDTSFSDFAFGELAPQPLTIFSNGTGGGDWNVASTWVGGIIPTAFDIAIVAAGDSVYLLAAGACDQLTLQAGSKLAFNAASLSMPGNTWSFDVTSIVYFNNTTTVPSGPVYGNLVYAAANGGPNGDLTVNGNLIVTAATMRGISTVTSGTRTHTIAGNVIVGPGISARISAVNNTVATSASCTWNIAGDVSLTGNSGGNRLILFESAGPHTGKAVFNINGDLTIGAASEINIRTSSSATASDTGTINVKGDFTTNGVTRTAGGTASTLELAMNGSSAQQSSGAFPNAFQTGHQCVIRIDNPAGVTLGTADTVRANVAVSLVNGLLTTTDANILMILDGGNIAGGSASSHVNGPLARSVPAGSPSPVFPIGSAGNYSPVGVQFATVSTAGTLKAATIAGEHPQILGSGIDATKSLNRYYVLTNSGIGFDTYSAVFTFVPGDVDGGADPLAFVAKRYDGSWADLTEGTRTATSTEITGATSFSDFAFGEAGGGGTVTLNVPVAANWNIVSLPVSSPLPDDSVRHLYINSVNPYAFAFAGAYVQRFTMSNGPGYWIKSSTTYTQGITGTARDTLTVPVANAWNMIGSISTSIDTSVAHVTPSAPGLRGSAYFRYNNGYTVATTIDPGLGYWVKANFPGSFFMHATGPARPNTETPVVGKTLEDLHRVTITDANGGSQTLYFGADVNDEIGVDMFQMPPAPPEGAFDARFVSAEGGTMVQTHAVHVDDIIDMPITLQSSAYPLKVTWTVAEGSYELSDGVTSRPVRGSGSMRITESETRQLVLRVLGEGVLPKEYALFQNYPNPFNPTTKVKYALPVESRVRAEMYNILGQRVKTLVSADQAAGYHVVEWNGANDAGSPLASGLYFLKLSANGVNGKTFTEVKKLMLMK